MYSHVSGQMMNWSNFAQDQLLLLGAKSVVVVEGVVRVRWKERTFAYHVCTVASSFASIYGLFLQNGAYLAIFSLTL